MKDFVVGRPKLINKELFLKCVQDILDSQIWSNYGQYVSKVESFLQEYLDCANVVLVNNATTGLELSLQALKKFKFNGSGDLSCLVPSFTFVATVSALKRNNITPIFGDIDEHYCLSERDGDNTDFKLPANLFGNISNVSSLIYDNAHALGVFDERGGSYVGANDFLSVFSLHATKMCGSGECGFITTNNNDVATYLREIINFGYDSQSGMREGNVVHYGTNGKVSEIQAAMALTQLENIQEIQEHYFNIHQEYEKLLPDLIKPKNVLFSNYSYVVAEVDGRDKLITQLGRSKIYPRTYFKPLHTMDAYRQNVDLPMTELISSRILCLPTGLCVSKDDVKYISKEVIRCLS